MESVHFRLNRLAKEKKEKLVFKRRGIEGNFISFTGRDGDFWVSIVPSLNVSGYGKTEEEAMEDLKYNLRVFFEDLLNLNPEQRIAELQRMGWQTDMLINTGFYIFANDREAEILKTFEKSDTVKKSILEAV